MRNEGERFYILKLVERLCPLAMDLEENHISVQKIGGTEMLEGVVSKRES